MPRQEPRRSQIFSRRHSKISRPRLAVFSAEKTSLRLPQSEKPLSRLFRLCGPCGTRFERNYWPCYNHGMGRIIAIGGGELKDLETLAIDRSIVKLAGKRRPRALFIPTASNDSVGYWNTFQTIYGKKLGCETDVLFLIENTPSRKVIQQKIFSADIIYVGGGNTLRMLRVWRKYGVDLMLKKAYQKGIILSGLSAGAIAWFRYGSSDSRCFMKNGKAKPTLMRVSGLNLLPITVSPHHIREKKLRDPGIKQMMEKTPGIALALDDNAAICIEGDKYKILRSKPDAEIAKVFRMNGKVKKILFPESGLLADLYRKG